MADVKRLHVGLICSPWDLNLSRLTPRKPADAMLLQNSLAKNGWMDSQGTILVFDKKSPIWTKVHDQFIEDEYIRRQARYNELKADKSEDARKEQIFFELMYVDKGKVFKPTHFNNSAFSRMKEIYQAYLKRYLGFTFDGDVYSSQPNASLEIPVLYHVYNNEIERENEQSDENMMKLYCNVKPSDHDCLLWVKHAMDTRPVFTMKDAKDRFPGTTGQRDWQLCKLARLWSPSCRNLFSGEPEREDAKIIDRCSPLYKGADGFRIQLFNPGGVNLTYLINRSTPDGLVKLNEAIVKRNEEKKGSDRKLEDLETPLTRDELETFLGKKKTKTGSKTLDKETWEALADNGKNTLLSDLAKGNLRKDTSTIGHMDRFAEVYNPVYGDLQDGKEIYLSKLMSHRNDPSVVKVIDLLVSGTKSDKILDTLSKIK